MFGEKMKDRLGEVGVWGAMLLTMVVGMASMALAEPPTRDFAELGSGRESAAELLAEVERGALDGAPMKGIVLRIAADAKTSPDKLSADLRRLLAGIDGRQPWAETLLLPVVADKDRAAALNARLEADLASWAKGWQRTSVTWVGDAAQLDARKADVIGATPRIASLDGVWQFRREIVVEAGVEKTNAAPAWTAVEVPHDWSIRDPFPPDGPSGSGKLSWGGTGRYRRTFEVSAAEIAACAKGGRVYLQFDGAMARPEVFVNGRKAGGWDYGYMSFTVNATDFVRTGSNVLEVFCDTRPHKSRWYPGGGLYRSVRLKVMPRDHVVPDSIAITTPVVTKERATVRVSYVSSLRGPDEYEFEVESPRLWDVDDPHLYTLELLGETFRYGIRTARFTADDGFHLNGRRVQLKGVDLHADMGPLGMAFNRSVMRRQLAIMKEMGANALRTSHNAPDPQVLELCDEMGILVWDECFDKWEGTASRYDWENVEEFIGRNLVAFVKRDRNHPSVVAWSQSNEIVPANGASPWGLTRGRHALFRRMMRAEDETRPIGNGNVTHTMFPRLRTTDIHADLDITGWNYGACYREIRAKYPEMPLVYTESASAVSSFGAYENPPAGNQHDWPVTVGDISAYDHNCGPDIPDVEFDRMETDRYVAGEFVWTGIDYLGEPFPYTPNNVGKSRNLPNAQMARSAYFGICDLNGFPKDRYWLYRSYWRPEAFTLHILPHWNWMGKEGKNVPVYVYTNGDEAELFLNGRSLGRRRKGEIQKADPSKGDFRANAYYEVCDKYRLRWLDVPYEPGELKVIAYRNGAKLGEKAMKTAGRPVRVRLTPEESVLPADGKTVVFCAVDLVDADGVRDPWAKDKVAFRIEGPGELLSVSNGDAREQASFVSFSGYPLYYGKACVTIRRRAGETGPVRLIATSGDLAPGIVEFKEPARTNPARRQAGR